MIHETPHTANQIQAAFSDRTLCFSEANITGVCPKFVAYEAQAAMGSNAAIRNLCKPGFSR
jgi:hypothetical protein